MHRTPDLPLPSITMSSIFQDAIFQLIIIGAFGAKRPFQRELSSSKPKREKERERYKGSGNVEILGQRVLVDGGGWVIQAGARDACQKERQLTHHLFHLRLAALTLALGLAKKIGGSPTTASPVFHLWWVTLALALLLTLGIGIRKCPPPPRLCFTYGG